MRRTWLLQLLLALVFTSIGVGLGVIAWNESEWGLWLAVAVVAGVGLLLVAGTARVRAGRSTARTDAEAVVASMTPPDPGAWTFATIGEEISERLADRPFVVDVGPEVIRIHVNLTDAQFLTQAVAAHVQQVRGLDVVLRSPGDAVLRDWSRGVEITADGARFTAEAEMFSGNQFIPERRLGSDVDQNEAGQRVDDEFDARELHGPVTQILQEAGWWHGWLAALSTKGQIALLLGGVGVAAIPLIPLTLLILWVVKR